MEDNLGVWVVVISIIIILALVFLIAMLWVGWWMSDRSRGISPYTGLPLRRATDLSYYSAEHIMGFLYDLHQYDNRPFRLRRAAFCRETGRIFQDCVNWMDMVKVDWNFLQKRYPGHYVSWGSLTKDQKDYICEAHHSLEGFQTEFSSPTSSPRAIEPEYAYAKPGPLYVDFQQKVLLGWKEVPETNLEVLIVQKPIK